MRPLFDRLRARGVRVAKPGGGMFPPGDIDPGNTFFTHPKDTFGQLEFEGKRATGSTRRSPVPAGLDDGPMAATVRSGIERLSHLTTVVHDVDPARALLPGRARRHGVPRGVLGRAPAGRSCWSGRTR